MKRPVLTAEKRTVLGKKVKKLRREGLIPANVYGKGIPSVALQVKTDDFATLYKEVGTTGVLDLHVEGKSQPVMIKSMQYNFEVNLPLHVDFYKVNLKEKVKTSVPVVITDEAQAIADKLGMLLQSLSEVEIEALPDKLPENIEVSVAHLAAVGEQITVGDLKAPEGVEILSDPAQTIAKVAELVVAEPEPEEEVVEGEEATEETAEGGEEKTEETPAEETEKTEESSEEKAE